MLLHAALASKDIENKKIKQKWPWNINNTFAAGANVAGGNEFVPESCIEDLVAAESTLSEAMTVRFFSRIITYHNGEYWSFINITFLHVGNFTEGAHNHGEYFLIYKFDLLIFETPTQTNTLSAMQIRISILGEFHPLAQKTERKHSQARNLILEDFERKKKQKQKVMPLSCPQEIKQIPPKVTPPALEKQQSLGSHDYTIIAHNLKTEKYHADNGQSLLNQELSNLGSLDEISFLKNKASEDLSEISDSVKSDNPSINTSASHPYGQKRQSDDVTIQVKTNFGNDNQHSMDTLGKFSDCVLAAFNAEKEIIEGKVIQHKDDDKLRPFIIKTLEDDDFFMYESDSNKENCAHHFTIISEWLKNPQKNINSLQKAAIMLVQVRFTCCIREFRCCHILICILPYLLAREARPGAFYFYYNSQFTSNNSW